MLFTLGASASEKKKLLAHVMPWYEAKETSGKWGWHWTMQRFNPENVDETGKREVASHYYPLLGAYDSTDRHAVECQVQWMKLAGIDGVIIDWYGIKNFRDYGFIHEATKLLIEVIKTAGLEFAVCYEDRTIRPMIAREVIPADSGVSHASEVMQWLAKNWFNDPSYVKIGGRPILPVFGPMYFRKPEEWGQILSDINPRPIFYSLPHVAPKTNADGVFGWPPVYGGRECKPAEWKRYLGDLYSRKTDDVKSIAIAFPKFQDIYEKSYGSLDDQNGETFAQTLDLALASDSELIQIATWNDYGESTIIEPTREFEYKYLEVIQSKLGIDSEERKKALRLPIRLFELRKSLGNDGDKETLNRISALLLSGEYDSALKELESL